MVGDVSCEGFGVAAVSRRGIEAEDKRKIKGGLPPDKDRNRMV